MACVTRPYPSLWPHRPFFLSYHIFLAYSFSLLPWLSSPSAQQKCPTLGLFLPCAYVHSVSELKKRWWTEQLTWPLWSLFCFCSLNFSPTLYTKQPEMRLQDWRCLCFPRGWGPGSRQPLLLLVSIIWNDSSVACRVTYIYLGSFHHHPPRTLYGHSLLIYPLSSPSDILCICLYII